VGRKAPGVAQCQPLHPRPAPSGRANHCMALYRVVHCQTAKRAVDTSARPGQRRVTPSSATLQAVQAGSGRLRDMADGHRLPSRAACKP